MQLSTASAGNQAVMSDIDEFMRMAERGHARRIAAERLSDDVHKRIDYLASRLTASPLSPAEIKGELLALAILVDDHAEQRHAAYLEGLAEGLEGNPHGNI